GGTPGAEPGAGEDLLEPLSLAGAVGSPGRRPGRHLRVGRGVVGDAEPTLERVDDVGCGDEIAERWQIRERVESESLKELARRAVHHGLSRPPVAPHPRDVPAAPQPPHYRPPLPPPPAP